MVIDLAKIKPNVVTTSPVDKLWLLYGDTGTRKTSVACSFPNHLLIAIDVGYKLIPGAMPQNISSWSEFKMVVSQLAQKENRERFDVIAIDTVGMLYQMCYQFCLRQMGISDPGEKGFGMGWKKIRLEFEEQLRKIPQMGYGLIMLAHSDEVEKEDKDTKEVYVTTKIDIDKRPDLIIKQLADFAFFLRKEPHEETGEPTVYAYTNLIKIETKSRARHFTPKFEFTYENLTHELSAAVKKDFEERGLELDGASTAPINYYEKTDDDFDELVEKAIGMVQSLLDTPFEAQMTEIVGNLFSEPISKLKNSARNAEDLKILYTSLKDLKGV